MSGRFVDVSVSAEATMPAYLVEASGNARRPGLILLQEIFGVTAGMRQTAHTFAGLGYDVVVPDLYWRQQSRVELEHSSAADRERAMALMRGLNQDLAVNDALVAAAQLRRSDHSSGKIGAVGYCLGGKLAFLLSMRTGIDAAVSYYGVGIQGVLEAADKIAAPVLLHIAANDELCPPQAQAAIHAVLANRRNIEIIDHAGVGHAFARVGSSAFNERAAEEANNATRGFLSRHLLSRI